MMDDSESSDSESDTTEGTSMDASLSETGIVSSVGQESDPDWNPDVGDHKMDNTLAWNPNDDDSDLTDVQDRPDSGGEASHSDRPQKVDENENIPRKKNGRSLRKKTDKKESIPKKKKTRKSPVKKTVSMVSTRRRTRSDRCSEEMCDDGEVEDADVDDEVIHVRRTPGKTVAGRISSPVEENAMEESVELPDLEVELPDLEVVPVELPILEEERLPEIDVSTRSRRRVVMNLQQCSAFASSAAGISALKQPLNRTNNDPNKGLYPVHRGARIGPSELRETEPFHWGPAQKRNDCAQTEAFATGIHGNMNDDDRQISFSQPSFRSAQDDLATKIFSASQGVVHDSPTKFVFLNGKEPSPKKTPTKRSKRSDVPVQKNCLTNYFSVAKKRLVAMETKSCVQEFIKGPIRSLSEPVKQKARNRSNTSYLSPFKFFEQPTVERAVQVVPQVSPAVPDRSSSPPSNQQLQDIMDEFNNNDFGSDSDQELLNAEINAMNGESDSASAGADAGVNAGASASANAGGSGSAGANASSAPTFGLVQVPVPPGVNYFSDLPTEIIENIFSTLPMLDLVIHCNRVCKRWKEIIEGPNFCVWKKIYHRVKAEVPDAGPMVTQLMHQHGMEYPNQFLVGLIKYMSDFKPITSRNMLSCVSRHRKYPWVVRLFKERLQECHRDGEPDPWSAITTILLLSETVGDVTELLRHMMGSTSRCTAIEITECCYCVATFLLRFTRARFNGPWQGMHYRLFYALYLYENSHATSVEHLADSFINTGPQNTRRSTGRQSSVRMTNEQLRIVRHDVKPGEIIKIVAFAGTGKTTTLVKYTELRPKQKFLLAVFNKSVQVEASKVFPRNVECKTSHSLAWSTCGARYKHKQNDYSLRAYTVMKEIRMGVGMNMFTRAKCIVQTVKNYIASADVTMTTRHVPGYVAGPDGRKEIVPHGLKMEIVTDSGRIWKSMCDHRNKFGMTHDGYLKLYQLSKPILDKYDCILIDEAQDLTPAVQDILIRQPQAKILVGDPRQQIYAFRGAVDAMSLVRSTDIFYLTQSFRFGPEIAHVASSCLQVLHDEQRKTLVGGAQPGGVTGESEGQVAVITRTNFELFRQAQLFVNDPENQGTSVAFVGGVAGFGFDVIEDIYYLSLPVEERGGRGGNTPFVSKFKTLADLSNYANKTDDVEILAKIKIVNTYMSLTIPHIRKITSRATGKQSSAQVVFTTAHKAKGLEFPTVRLGEDFLNLEVLQTDQNETLTDVAVRMFIHRTPIDERNLLYVAVTRAKTRLIASARLLLILKMCGETFVTPRLSADMLKENGGDTLTCSCSEETFQPNVLTLVRKCVTLSDKTERPSQIYSPSVVTQYYGPLAGLMGEYTDSAPAPVQ